MRTTLVLLAAAVLVGCASVLSSSDKNVLVEHGAADASGAVALAERECQKHGKRAMLDQMRCPYGCVSQFRCE